MEDYRILAKLKDCQLCGSDLDKEVHHIKPRREGGVNDYNNLTVLCSLCHRMFHADKRFSSERSEKVKSTMIKTENGTYSYKGNKWGRKGIDTETKKQIMFNHKYRYSQREIQQIMLEVWGKKISLGLINKIINQK